MLCRDLLTYEPLWTLWSILLMVSEGYLLRMRELFFSQDMQLDRMAHFNMKYWGAYYSEDALNFLWNSELYSFAHLRSVLIQLFLWMDYCFWIIAVIVKIHRMICMIRSCITEEVIKDHHKPLFRKICREVHIWRIAGSELFAYILDPLSFDKLLVIMCS